MNYAPQIPERVNALAAAAKVGGNALVAEARACARTIRAAANAHEIDPADWAYSVIALDEIGDRIARGPKAAALAQAVTDALDGEELTIVIEGPWNRDPGTEGTGP